MDRKLRYVWWFVLVGFMLFAIWKLFLPHGSNAYLQKTSSSREIVVYVAGAVEKPGLVHLTLDARLDDALKLVSPLPEANLESMNPAEKLKDGQKVTVPYKSLPSSGSVVGGNQSAGLNSGAGNITAVTNGAGAGSAGAGNASGSADGKININTAGVSELDKLPGVGPALAGRIIQYRTEHGPFSQPEDLRNISGIGAKTYEKMASQVMVGP
jgi:competence protein ComEA